MSYSFIESGDYIVCNNNGELLYSWKESKCYDRFGNKTDMTYGDAYHHNLLRQSRGFVYCVFPDITREFLDRTGWECRKENNHIVYLREFGKDLNTKKKIMVRFVDGSLDAYVYASSNWGENYTYFSRVRTVTELQHLERML